MPEEAMMTSFTVARSVVEVAGPDAERFLHGQLSQDIASMAVGASRWSFLLQPTGKVVALLRVTRVEAERFLLDAEPGVAEVAVARLQRFLIRTKAELVVQDGWAWSSAVPEGASGSVPVVGWWGAEPGGVLASAPDGGLDAIGYEAARLAAGWPANGTELDEGTIPAESGVVAVAASFTKGCYTGQELVERIDSRGGNVARRLHRLHVPAGTAWAAGDVLVVDGADVGRVTSVAGPVGLGYVARAAADATVVGVATGGGAVDATVSSVGAG